MLNFDMIGSPNPTRGIYDGDSGDEDVRLLSSSIQRLFGFSLFFIIISSASTPHTLSLTHSNLNNLLEEYFNSHGLEWTPSPFTGRSDYGSFFFFFFLFFLFSFYQKEMKQKGLDLFLLIEIFYFSFFIILFRPFSTKWDSSWWFVYRS